MYKLSNHNKKVIHGLLNKTLKNIIWCLLIFLFSCKEIDVEHTFNENAVNRQRCFNGQYEFCNCENPGSDAEADFCEENDL